MRRGESFPDDQAFVYFSDAFLESLERLAEAERVENVEGRPVGVVEALVAGPRRAGAVYDMADALRRSGRITDAEMTEVWEALALLDTCPRMRSTPPWSTAGPPTGGWTRWEHSQQPCGAPGRASKRSTSAGSSGTVA